MLEQALAYMQPHLNSFQEQLFAFLRIPSVSTEAAHRPDIEQAAAWLAEQMTQVGLEHVAIMPTDGHPVVYGDWLHAGPTAPTILVYGHYDVQPPGDPGDWSYPPFAATVVGDRVYARGASDNKAQHFSHIKAVECFLSGAGRLPVNLKFCLDGEEEVGSPHLEPFVRQQADRLAADLLVISDGAMFAPGRPSLEYALRGIVALDLRVAGQPRALHSGSYGGTVHNPALALVEILASLHRDDGSVAIPGFYDRVRPLEPAERALLARVPYTEAQWREETGALTPWGEADFSLLERMTARPTCEINGLWSGYQGEGTRTIIPPSAGAKISFRLVADQDPNEVLQLLRAHLDQVAPPTVRVTVTAHAGAPAAVTAYDSPALQRAADALEAVWGRRPVVSRAGGSLPIVAAFQQQLGLDYILMPLGLDDNRHGPDEHYNLPYFRRGIEAVVRLYALLGTAGVKGSN